MRKKRRYNIALLVSGIGDEFTIRLCSGVLRAAREKDVNIYVLPGKYIYRDTTGMPDLAYEYQYSTVFSSVTKENIDGLIIVAGCIGCLTTKEKLMGFLENFRDIPNVLLASDYEGYDCICYDNESAVIEGIKCMIEQGGCHKICMVDSFVENSDAEARRRAYEETLKKYGVPFSEDYIARGDLAYSPKTKDAVEDLLKRHPDMDGLFCVNDDSARAAYDVLKARDIMPGRDIYVMGYDNTLASVTLDPPLSTVAADPVALAAESVYAILRKLEGEEIGNVVLPGKFIRRESFGKLLEIGGDDEKEEEASLHRSFEIIFYHYINNFGVRQAEKVFKKYYRLMVELRAMNGSDAEGAKIRKSFEELAQTGAFLYMDMDEFLLSVERQSAVALEKGLKTVKKDNILKLQGKLYRRLIQTVDKRLNAINQEQWNLDFSMKNFVRESLSFRHGNDQSYQVFLSYLDWLDIRNACLYLRKEPAMHLEWEPFHAAEEYEMKAICLNGVVSTPARSIQHRTLSQLYRNEYMGSGRREVLVLPLFFTEEVYGLLCCDLTDKLYREAEFVANQLGAAAHALHVLRQNEETQLKLEEHLSLLKRHNIELDTISRSDPLTGILNRRGFELAAEEFWRCRKKKGCLVGYVDMNNLKIVNDRFGHEEGDFALRKIAEVMQQVLPEGAVMGRIGGDEYAFVTEGEAYDVERITFGMKDTFASFNEGSDKPYNVTASVGICHIRADSDMDLEEMLSEADGRLYIAKQNKDRNILKDLTGG